MTEKSGSSETLLSLYQIPWRRIQRDLYEATVFPNRIIRLAPAVSFVKYEHSYWVFLVRWMKRYKESRAEEYTTDNEKKEGLMDWSHLE